MAYTYNFKFKVTIDNDYLCTIGMQDAAHVTAVLNVFNRASISSDPQSYFAGVLKSVKMVVRGGEVWIICQTARKLVIEDGNGVDERQFLCDELIIRYFTLWEKNYTMPNGRCLQLWNNGIRDWSIDFILPK